MKLQNGIRFYFSLGVVALGLQGAALGVEGVFSLSDTAGDHLDVLMGGKLAGRYMYGHDTGTPARRLETYKPYLHVFNGAGTRPITKGPGGDFTHHRGIFLGWSRLTVNGKEYDRWHMKGGDQVHESFLEKKAGPADAHFTSVIRWVGAGTDTILEEKRTHVFRAAPAPGYVMVDMESKLKAVGGETRLAGDPEHAGLQFRPAADVALDETKFFYPKAQPEPHRDHDYPWVGESFVLEGKTYSVVYLNHPLNPKDAPTSAYRDYGRFGMFFTTTIPAGQELTLRVRFLLIEGEMPSAAWIQKAANSFTGESNPVPAMTMKPAEKASPKKAPARAEAK